MKRLNKHIGSDFDDFLKEEGINMKKEITLNRSKIITIGKERKTDLYGKVVINGKQLEEGKDFTVTEEGISLSKKMEENIYKANSSYSIYFSKKVSSQTRGE